MRPVRSIHRLARRPALHSTPSANQVPEPSVAHASGSDREPSSNMTTIVVPFTPDLCSSAKVRLCDSGDRFVLGIASSRGGGVHAIAALLAVLGTYLLWRRGRGNPRAQFVAMSFGVSAVFLYAASATYHALQLPWEQLRYLLLVDTCAIFVLIAGTYTPVVLVIIPPGRRRIGFFTAIWFIAAAGIAFKVLTFLGVISQGPYWIVVLLYLGMGWLGLALILDMVLRRRISRLAMADLRRVGLHDRRRH